MYERLAPARLVNVTSMLALRFALLLALVSSTNGRVPGCSSLYGAVGEDENIEIDVNDIPLCFCDRFPSGSADEITITCLYGSSPADMAKAAELVLSANKSVHQIYLNHMEFGEDGLTANFFKNISVIPKDLTIGSCPNPTELLVDEEAFAGMEEQLVNLTITDCIVSNVSSAVRRLTGLQRLHLSTSLEKIGPEDFAGLNNLRHLDLSENYLSYIHPAALEPLTKLEILELGPKNELDESIYEAVNRVPSLRQLDMSISRLEVWPPGALNKLSNLEKLHLRSNNFVNLTEGMFEGLSSLVYLDLRVNLIKNIEPGTFAALEKLNTLLITGNFIDELTPGVFEGLENLKELDVGWNEFVSIGPDTFSNLGALQLLDLRHNIDLSDIDVDAFNGLGNVNRLNLSQTNLTAWNSEVLKPLKSLNALDLSEANLQELPDDAFLYGPKLNEIYLRDNYLSDVSPAVLASAPSVQILDVSGNPWICDDQLGIIITILARKYEDAAESGTLFYLENAVDTRCARPYSLRDQKIMSLNPSELEPYDPADEMTTTTEEASTTEEGEYEETTRPGGKQTKVTPAPVAQATTEEPAGSAKLVIAIVVIVVAAVSIVILIIIVVIMRKKKSQVSAADAEMTTVSPSMTNGELNQNGSTKAEQPDNDRKL